ncbi:hypothetical protein [Amycolatopsis sp. NPDC004079]|uniref:hypothetical protein n=1 Tax=Amycolatopsis sp. NPDC004079 TaxID=3154549 RepID=UPI0033B59304
MTRSYLDITIAIGRQTDARALLRECRRLLGTPDEAPPIESRAENPLLLHRRGRLANPLYWDFPATLSIGYGIDGPMTEIAPEGASAQHRRSLAADPVSNGWAWAEVLFQPFVGWPEISPGAPGDDLGAWLVRELGRWLDGKGLPWQWEARGASVYLPYSRDTANLAALGNADADAVTPETVRLVNERYLPGWLRGWDGPTQLEGTLLKGWQA